MKITKLYIALFMIAAAVFTACDDFEDTVEPSPAVPEGCLDVFFPNTNASMFELEPADAKEIMLTVSRGVTEGAAEVPLTVEENTDDIFQVPASVTFAAGEAEAEFKVTFPDAGEGTAYKLKIAVEGDQFVNPYAATKPYVSTAVSRVKWVPMAEPMVYIDGTFSAFYGVDLLPMYVWAEKAQLGSSVRYRFKNAYRVPVTGEWVDGSDGPEYVATPDEDGIYDGYPYNWPGDFDESQDYYTVIEIDDPEGISGKVTMTPHEIGTVWKYGMFSIGSIYPFLSDKVDEYPLGTLSNEVVTFGESSLFISMADYDEGAPRIADTPTLIYLTKDAYIKANLKIEDYNDVDYEVIAGQVSEFWSNAYDEAWPQSFAKAIDADPENEESDYKNLYYLADLYVEGKGLAFYYPEGGKLEIPDMQATGLNIFGEEVYVSQSPNLKSTVEVNAKGISVYTLGLMFHYKDGTIIGDFDEVYYYGKAAPTYEMADYLGDFVMTGPSLFQGGSPANMNVTIAEGAEANTLVITGVTYAEEIVATFDPVTGNISVAPQALADFEENDVTLYTFSEEGPGGTEIIELMMNLPGQIVVAPTSVAFGYLLRSESLGGWLAAYYNMVFTPVPAGKASTKSVSTPAIRVQGEISWTQEEAKRSHNFKVQGKINPKAVKKNLDDAIIF
ncbi:MULTISPECIES: hypothetical protein [unclassified Carboxylicivirga]|uniref:hypothetical protein n=1 Tax=Carboxylicivirga TaxID=1628153 RepID=UPI003D34A3B3